MIPSYKAVPPPKCKTPQFPKEKKKNDNTTVHTSVNGGEVGSTTGSGVGRTTGGSVVGWGEGSAVGSGVGAVTCVG